MKYFVKFTIKNEETKEKKIIESNKCKNLEQAQQIMENYLKRQITKSSNIKMLGNNKAKVEKFGGNILVEIIEKN